MRKIKIINSLLTIAVLLFMITACMTGIIDIHASEAEERDIYTSGDYDYIILEDGTVEIIRYRRMDRYMEIPEVIDGRTVTGIDENALYKCDNLTVIKLPDSLIEVKGNLFSTCKNLSSIIVSSEHPTLEVIDNVLFSKPDKRLIVCSRTKKGQYAVPQGTEIIDNSAFRNCVNLTGIVFPDSIKSLGSEVINDCRTLTNITLPDNLTDIDIAFFKGCDSLSNVYVSPDNSGLVVIDNVLFSKDEKRLIWCSRTKKGEYEIPQGIEIVDSYAFINCTNLTSIVFPDSIISIEENAINGCTALTSISIPNSVSDVRSDFFDGCDNLSIINISLDHPTLAVIDNVLFSKPDRRLIWCPKTKEGTYEIPQGIEVVDDHAFYGCDGLTGIVIPDSVTDIPSNLFEGCNSISEVTVSPDHPLLSAVDNVLFRKTDNCLLWCPKDKEGKYEIPDETETIDALAFYDCNSLTEVTVPDSVTDINASFFHGCFGLRRISVSPDHPTLEVIDDVLFNKSDKRLIWCPKDKAWEYEIPQGTITVGEYAFGNCRYLTGIIIPDSVTELENHSFFNCSNLISVRLSEGLKNIGDHAFDKCCNLSDIIFPNGLINIGECAFDCCLSLISIEMPDSLVSIGAWAFNCCWGISDIILPDSLTSIGDYAFGNKLVPVLTVPRNSYAQKYCEEYGINYKYEDSLNWLSS